MGIRMVPAYMESGAAHPSMPLAEGGDAMERQERAAMVQASMGPVAAASQGFGAVDLAQRDPNEFDFAVLATEKESGDDRLLLFENLEDARRAFRRLKGDDGIEAGELIDQRSGNILDEFEKDEGFPFGLVLGGVAAGVAGLWLARKFLEGRGGGPKE